MPFKHDAGYVAACYQAADIYIHATKTDNFPTTVLEAMACGLPVVGTAVGGVPEQIDDGITGILVAPGDADDLAAAIAKLGEDAELRTTMGRAGRARVLNEFTDDRTAVRYVDCYEQAVRFSQGAGQPSPREYA
jgi:glycosyltransferase involved in cell wall biosynthesis